MKLCADHESACSVALTSRGLSTADRVLGKPHTGKSALHQVLLSAAYGRFGVRAMRDDMCPLCELGDEESKKLITESAVLIRQAEGFVR